MQDGHDSDGGAAAGERAAAARAARAADTRRAGVGGAGARPAQGRRSLHLLFTAIIRQNINICIYLLIKMSTVKNNFALCI